MFCRNELNTVFKKIVMAKYNEKKRKYRKNINFRSRNINLSQGSVTMRPEDIRFSQDSVAMQFYLENPVRKHTLLNSALEQIAKGNMRAENFPSITVVKHNGKYYKYKQ